MNRPIPTLVMILLVASPLARAQDGGNSQRRGRAGEEPRRVQQETKLRTSPNSEALLQYHASQAALFSALAHAAALEELTNLPGADMDMARTYVHTINREAQACEGTSVKVGQAVHSAEKQESMKTLRNELKEAMKAIDDAQSAVDGHGPLGPHSKNASAHLEKAMIALVQLGREVGVRPLPAPGADILGAESFPRTAR
jgi:hypothetical protein